MLELHSMLSSTDADPNIRDPPEGIFPFDLDLQIIFAFSFPALSAPFHSPPSLPIISTDHLTPLSPLLRIT